jgi:hypothetical protein
MAGERGAKCSMQVSRSSAKGGQAGRRRGGGKDSRTISAASAAVKRGVSLRSERRKRLVSLRCPERVSKGPASNGDEPGGQPSPPAACCARSTPRRGAAGTPVPCSAPTPARCWKQPKSCTNGGLVPVSAFVPAALPLALALALTLRICHGLLRCLCLCHWLSAEVARLVGTH